MLELMLCCSLTLLPDFLIRRFVQGKRLGKEITLFSVWYELRWGITLCLILTVLLITIVLYNHPSSKDVNALFRTVSIFAETGGRVSEVYVGYNQKVKKGQPLFKLDSKRQEADIETARARVVEVEAGTSTAKADVLTSQSRVDEAKANLQQAKDELDVKTELQRRNPGIVPQRDIEKLQVLVDQRQAGIDVAAATKQSAIIRVATLLPAEKASAEAALAQAQVDLDKTYVRAGVTGRVEQFALRTGDVVNPLMRPAGILIPEGAGQRMLQAGFGQIEAQVLKEGMVAEATCVSRPWVIIPMVVTMVHDYIAACQVRGGEQLIEVQNVARPGTILVHLEPLYKGGLEGVTAGSSCIVNAYTSNHETISAKDTSTGQRIVLHVIDGVGLVHALLLRIQALLLPIKTLVLSGH